MTEDKIIELARKAWSETGEGWTAEAWFASRVKSFQRFADLVAAEDRSRIADLESAGHKTAMELECLLLDCKDTVVVSKWFDTGMAALSAWQELFEYQGPRLGD
jgi:hypothetical protein